MLRQIKVYGKLAKFLGWRSYWADVGSAAEAVRFLAANWPETRKHMADQYYKITVGDYNVGGDELNDPAGQSDVITIVPVMVGSKSVFDGFKRFFSSGIGKIILGAAIFVAAPWLGAAAIGTFGLGAGSIALATIASGIGVSLMLGGVSQMLSPVPEYPTGSSEFGSGEDALDPQSNYSFGGIQNVSRSGVPVALIYGWEVMTGSVVVSNGIDTAQVEGTA